MVQEMENYLEGTATRLMGGSGAKVVVNGYWDSNLIADVSNAEFGLL